MGKKAPSSPSEALVLCLLTGSDSAHRLPCALVVCSSSTSSKPSVSQTSLAGTEQGNSPEPSGRERTKVGSIFTVAVELVSLPRPFTISAWKRAITSSRTSSERRMWYRYLSTWRRARCHEGGRQAPRCSAQLGGRCLHAACAWEVSLFPASGGTAEPS